MNTIQKQRLTRMNNNMPQELLPVSYDKHGQSILYLIVAGYFVLLS